MVIVRNALETDAEAIRDIFHVVYGDKYFYPQYYDVQSLKRMIFGDDTVFLVAEETDTGRILGTASVLLDVGAYADLVAEFGRLAVHPDGRGQGIGKQLMAERIKAVEDRIHVGIVENRCAHEFSQRISHRNGFHPVGLLPDKFLLSQRESVSPYVRYFGQALALRRNHPRLIPEAFPIAELAFRNCELSCDAIIDSDVRAYPHIEQFQIEEMNSELYPSLLRFERGRVKHREIFGRMRLHYGLFQLRSSDGRYLLAYRNGVLTGAIGILIDEHERTGKIFELVSLDESPIYFLVEQLVQRCRGEFGLDYLEVDLNAYSPKIQQTFLENGFLPAAYIPAMVFHDVERLDIVRMVRLFTPWDSESIHVYEAGRPIADLVDQSLRLRNAQPRLVEAVGSAPLFAGLSSEQQQSVAACAELESFAEGAVLFREGDPEEGTRILLSGEVEILNEQSEIVGSIDVDESFGDLASLDERTHHVTAKARTGGEALLLPRPKLLELIHNRPDIGMILFRNLCSDLADKLLRMNQKARNR